jgi:soluble lytic murein transglycosylase
MVLRIKSLEEEHKENTELYLERLEKHSNYVSDLEKRVSITERKYEDVMDIREFIISINKKIDYDTALSYAEIIINETEKYPLLSHKVLSAIIAQESRFKNDAISPMNAKGLGQLTPIATEFACSKLGLVYDDSIYFNPEMNIKISAWFINWCISRYNDIDVALAYYNGGHYQAYRYKSLLKKLNGYRLTKQDLINIDKLPDETANYVPSVNMYIGIFNKIKR